MGLVGGEDGMNSLHRLIWVGCFFGALACGDTEVQTTTHMPAQTDLVDTGVMPALPVNCLNPNTEAATAACLRPTQSPAYYVAQAEAYFDTLDVDASRDSVPNYHEQVARWEWPPWLLLTGYGARDMIRTSDALRLGDPSTVPVRDCRFFDIQPFARCYVEFEYEEGRCPIYEEFTFNDAGEMTFIEAWSDRSGMLPIKEGDTWAEDPEFYRLATRVPGLGNTTGTAVLDSDYMRSAAMSDPIVADYAQRATNWIRYWSAYVLSAGNDFFAIGCGWSTEHGEASE